MASENTPAFDVFVVIGSAFLRVRSDSTSVAPWLTENLGPWIVSGGGRGAPDWTVEVSADPDRLAALRARRSQHGDRRLCFAQDRLLHSLPARDDDGATLLADDERDSFLAIRPGRVELCFDDTSRRGRMMALWTLVELAVTERGAGQLDFHASAVVAGGRGLLLAGDKGAGKTTLLLHLVASGAAELVANDRVFAFGDGEQWSILGLPAPLRVRPGTLPGLPGLPTWATALERPYLFSLAEARDATAAPQRPGEWLAEDVLLGAAQVADWLGASIATKAPLEAVLFPEVRTGETGWSMEPLPPELVRSRLWSHRYGARLDGRAPTIFESLRGGCVAVTEASADRLACTVPGFALRLGRDAHLEKDFAVRFLEEMERLRDRWRATRPGRGDARTGGGSMPGSDTMKGIQRALGEAPEAAFTTPLVYPWSVQHFEAAPRLPRPAIEAGPVRLYVHVPFCRYHCSFCFYAVRTGAGDDEKSQYVDALLREFRELPSGTPVAQLFVGGGTPTALAPSQLARVLGALFERAPGQVGRLHTIEASPDSITADHLAVLREHGVGRVSMGLESLDEGVLETVRRRHTPSAAAAACTLVLDHGLVLNVDLIYGLPGQTEESFRRDVERAASLGVHSLCLYALRLNARTPVATAVGPGERLDLEHLVRWRRFVFRTAEEYGFVRRRPYFFERPGAPALPSQSPDQTLLGFGMSARSQIGGTVYRNIDRSADYVDRISRGESPVETMFHLGDGDRRALFVAATLGNGAPLRREAWTRRFGGSIDEEYGDRLNALREGGLLVDDGDSIQLAADGLLVYDRVVLGFYPADRAAMILSLPPPKMPAGGQS